MVARGGAHSRHVSPTPSILLRLTHGGLPLVFEHKGSVAYLARRSESSSTPACGAFGLAECHMFMDFAPYCRMSSCPEFPHESSSRMQTNRPAGYLPQMSIQTNRPTLVYRHPSACLRASAWFQHLNSAREPLRLSPLVDLPRLAFSALQAVLGLPEEDQPLVARRCVRTD